jgi:hypothetical protein
MINSTLEVPTNKIDSLSEGIAVNTKANKDIEEVETTSKMIITTWCLRDRSFPATEQKKD